MDKSVPEKIAEASYEKGFGARPVEKKTEDLIRQAIDNYLVEFDISRGQSVSVEFVETNGQFKIKFLEKRKKKKCKQIFQLR